MVTREPLREGPAGATVTDKQDVNGKIVEHLWHLRKQGYRPSTIKLRARLLKTLTQNGANLLDPESVKETIANMDRSESYKVQLVAAYHTFITPLGLTWQPPRYRQTRKLPFIPQEAEINTLIAGMGKKTATMLQLLKETGMRIGEAAQLRWKDIDTERCTVTVNTPEKNSNPRTLKASHSLLAMLQRLPTTSDKVFPTNTVLYIKQHFFRTRKRLAAKLQNPRLLNISFHTLRHWKATTEYHRTKDILHVMQLLGHREIKNTLIYTHLVDRDGDSYHVKTAKTLTEACSLAEAGFEYFTTIDGVQVFRKPK